MRERTCEGKERKRGHWGGDAFKRLSIAHHRLPFPGKASQPPIAVWYQRPRHFVWMDGETEGRPIIIAATIGASQYFLTSILLSSNASDLRILPVGLSI